MSNYCQIYTRKEKEYNNKVNPNIDIIGLIGSSIKEIKTIEPIGNSDHYPLKGTIQISHPLERKIHSNINMNKQKMMADKIIYIYLMNNNMNYSEFIRDFEKSYHNPCMTKVKYKNYFTKLSDIEALTKN